MSSAVRAPSRSAPGPDGERGTRGHVVIVVENVAFSIDIRVRKQVRDLLEAGYAVSVITREAPENAEFRGLPGLRIHEYRAPMDAEGAAGYLVEYGLALAWAAVHTCRIRLRERIDVVQFSQPPDLYFPIAWALRCAGTAVLVDQRDLMPELYESRYERPDPRVLKALRWLERRSHRVADRALAVNGFLAERAISAGARPDRVSVVGNGPRVSSIKRANPDPALRRGRPYLGCWIGKMGRQDRVDLLLHALHRLVHELGRTDMTVAILGDGECLEELRRMASDLRLDPWVVFPGWLGEEEVFRYLASADIGFDTSLQHEVTPVKEMEYMASGLPFVAFDLPETRRIGVDASVLIPAGDVHSFASAVDQLLCDQSERTRLGDRGRRRVREELSWEHQRAIYLDIVGSLMDRSMARR